MKTELLESGEIFSGIYKLIWPSGHFYIGRSADILKRYEQHKKSISAGNVKISIKQAIDLNPDNPMPRLEILYTNLKGDLSYNEGIIIGEARKSYLCVNINSNRTTKSIMKGGKKAKSKVKRRVKITELREYEFIHLLRKYGTIDDALKRLLELEPI